MKRIILIALLFVACKKEKETVAPAQPVQICKTCTTYGYVTLPTHTQVPYTKVNGTYCDGTWASIEGVSDTIEIKYNTKTKRNDTTWYHSQVICQ
jgi:hypothetical protein